MEIDKNDMDKADDIFRRAMAGVTQDDSSDAMALWENGFAQKVAKQNFYRFGFTHLNVFTVATVGYTVASLVAILLGSTYYVADSVGLFSSSKKGSPENKTTENAFIVDSCETKEYQGANRASRNGRRNDFMMGQENRDSTNNASIDSTLINLPDKDATVLEDNSIKPIQSDNESKVPVIKVVKKTIIIEKRDTLQTVDTIRSKKEWKKITKNKQ